MHWFSRLPLQLVGREASPQDKSCLPSVSPALKSAGFELVSLRERKFYYWVSLTATIVFPAMSPFAFVATLQCRSCCCFPVRGRDLVLRCSCHRREG